MTSSDLKDEIYGHARRECIQGLLLPDRGIGTSSASSPPSSRVFCFAAGAAAWPWLHGTRTAPRDKSLVQSRCTECRFLLTSIQNHESLSNWLLFLDVLEIE